MGTLTVEGGSVVGRDGIVDNASLRVETSGMPDAVVRLQPSDLITPGLVDLHLHLSAGGLYPHGMDQAQCFASGVVGCADAGSFGPANIAEAVPEWRKQPAVRVRSWLHLYGTGIHDGSGLPPLDDIVADLRAAVEALPDLVVGVKIRLGQRDRAGDELLLERGLAATEQLGLPVLVHLTGTALSAEEVARALRPGDVISHAFHGRAGRIVSDSGVLPGVRDAQRRGVILDTGHGRNHLSWRTLEIAMGDGVFPDTVSTDLTQRSWQLQPVSDLPTVVSKMIAAGMPTERALTAASFRPADLLSIDLADPRSLVVFRPDIADRQLPDAEGETRPVRSLLRPVLRYDANAGLLL